MAYPVPAGWCRLRTSPSRIRRLQDGQTLTTLLGARPAFRQAIANLPLGAPRDTPVPTTIETRPGKEFAATATTTREAGLS